MKITILTSKMVSEPMEAELLLIDALTREGYKTEFICWEDVRAEHIQRIKEEQGIVLIRTTWGYFLTPDKFLALIEELEDNGIPVYNNSRIIRENINKSYLLKLKEAGFPVIPTILLKKNEEYDLEKLFNQNGWSKAVIKPSISGGSYETYVIDINDIASATEKLKTIIQKNDILFQKFMPSIQDGEWSILNFSNGYTYAVRKKPLDGEFRVQHEYGGKYQLLPIPAAAAVINDQMREYLNNNYLYYRLDGVIADGQFYIMELEMIEPDLYLDINHEGVGQFVDAFKNKIMSAVEE